MLPLTVHPGPLLPTAFYFVDSSPPTIVNFIKTIMILLINLISPPKLFNGVLIFPSFPSIFLYMSS